MIRGKKRLLLNFIFVFLSMPYVVICLLFAIASRVFKKNNIKPRLVWGSKPIMNNHYWSDAMTQDGFESTTFVDGCVSINNRDDWDLLLQDQYKFLPFILKSFFAFIHSLFVYDVFFISFSGYFIGQTPLWWIQAYVYKIARKKVVVLAYGGDSYVYHKIRSTALIHGLMMSYPGAAREQNKISRRVKYWCKHADVLIPGLMGPDGFGRWDILTPSPIALNSQLWELSKRQNYSDGSQSTVIIAHAPNHRGFKGTEFIISAVQKLKDEGFKVELLLLEGLKNFEVRRILYKQVDILVDQLIYTGYALNALEGMSSGLPVISNIEDEAYTLPFRRWSYLDECPIISASPETIVDTLRKLVTRPKLRHQIGSAGRKYVEKYHSYEASQYLFGEVIRYLYGDRESLINLYHPILGEFSKQEPLVDHPLVNSHIVD